MNRIKKYLYIALGFIALGLGIIGIILPVLPTTPFLLVTSYCFAKGSDRFHNWFINTKVYKKHLESFVKERAMTLKEKVVLLSFLNFMLLIALWFHLTHGFWSSMQTLGWNNTIWINRWKCISNIYSTIIVLGFMLVAVVFFLKNMMGCGAC